jgi:spermidine synthase
MNQGGDEEARMIPWKFLDSAQVPGDSTELRLYERGGEFSIRVNRSELMNSRVHGSEDALAELACARIAGLPSPRVLIGGLGMGYTTAAALHLLGSGSRVEVAELVPAVVVWNRSFLAELAGHPLQDPRVTVREADVALILQEESQAYDAILLDVDNGPAGLTRKGNDRLYTRAGITTAFAALRPAGVLAVWSASTDRAFARRLCRAGFDVDEFPVRARGAGGGSRHTIWIAVRCS